MEEIFPTEFSEEELEKAFDKNIKDIKRSIEVEVHDDFGLQVWAVAVCKHGDNEDITIRCEKVVPISDVAYDTVKDCLYVQGVSYHKVGEIPFHFVVGVKGNLWKSEFPAPISVIRRYLTEAHKKEFDCWRANYSTHDFEIIFVQALNTYGDEE